MDLDRSLTEADVKAIVSELKTQLVKDFQLEVGKGVLGWVKKALILLLILAALYGISGTQWFKNAQPKTSEPGNRPLPAIVGKAAMRAVGVVPQGFTVIPPQVAPDDLVAMAAEIDLLNAEGKL
jgi:hypothetical protein